MLTYWTLAFISAIHSWHQMATRKSCCCRWREWKPFDLNARKRTDRRRVHLSVLFCVLKSYPCIVVQVTSCFGRGANKSVLWRHARLFSLKVVSTHDVMLVFYCLSNTVLLLRWKNWVWMTGWEGFNDITCIFGERSPFKLIRVHCSKDVKLVAS